MKTNDGGNTWTTLSTSITNHLYTVQMLDPGHIWIAGSFSSSFSSDDGGATWTTHAALSGATTWALHFFSNAVGLLIGGTQGTEQKIYRTADGGDNWDELTSDVTGAVESIRGLHFIDNDLGVACGFNGTLLRTEDAGKNWELLPSGTTNNLVSVHFPDATHGTVVGWVGTILHSTDAGATWTQQTSGTTEVLYDVFFTDANTGWAAGHTGTLVHTTDGGANWTIENSGVTNQLFSIAFLDANTGIIAGSNVILRTTNAGATWTPMVISGELREVTVIDPDHAIIVGWNGVIYLTDDAGATWSDHSLAVNRNFLAAAVHGADTITVVGESCVMFHSFDGGSTWQRQYDISNEILLAAQYAANGNIWATGDKGVILSSVSPDEVTGITEQPVPNDQGLQLTIAPNPFGPSTAIRYTVPAAGPAELVIVDQMGRIVRKLVAGSLRSGEHSLTWDGRSDNGEQLRPGVYFVSLRSGAEQQGTQVVLMDL